MKPPVRKIEHSSFIVAPSYLDQTVSDVEVSFAEVYS